MTDRANANLTHETGQIVVSENVAPKEKILSHFRLRLYLVGGTVINNVEIEFVTAEAAEKLEEFGGVGASLYYSGR